MSKLDFLKRAARWVATRALVIGLVIGALWIGYALGRHSGHGPHPAAPTADQQEQAEVWTCPMHPQIRMPEPGNCPICGMELVLETGASPAAPAERPRDAAAPSGYVCPMFCVPPLPEPGKCPVCGMEMMPVYDESAATAGAERRLVLSEEARALAAIVTAPVQRRSGARELRFVGVIEPDETRLARVSAYLGGRLERLHVRFTGVEVQRGAPLAGLYSPELLTARAELRQAKQSAARLSGSTSTGVREAGESAVHAARERLRLWGLSEAQIRGLEAGDADTTIITISSPISGTVLERHVQEGDYVGTGDMIFSVADLSTVWIQIKAYESDLPWIRLNQPVHFTAEAWPGETFHGRVSFIAPVLDSATRTVNVRVETPNADGRLKPGMYVRARMEIPIAPEGAPLPLTVPATAPLITGTRAVVYVEVPGQERPTYEGREIVLGPKAGDYYIVEAGLAENERVVVQGAFRLDSALQIRAKPSMMHTADAPPADSAAAHEHVHAPATLDSDTVRALPPVLDAYVATQQALAADDPDVARKQFAELARAAEAARASLSDATPQACVHALQAVRDSAQRGRDADDIHAARREYETASKAAIELLELASDWVAPPVARVYCPMAFDDKGAAWLQRGEEVRNPYFGASMLQCGAIQKWYGPSHADQ